MRLAVLSEIADEWAATLRGWMAESQPLRSELESGTAPDEGEAAMLFQMLVASWPLGLSAEDREGIDAWVERLAGWQQKAMREAKRRTGWGDPDQDYEDASRAFLDGVLEAGSPLLPKVAAFAARIASAGAAKSLAQVVLRLTTPGVPDLYQGTEYWDESLVDPDNRRPVDFPARAASLGPAPAELLGHWQDGAVKQAVIQRLLQLRAAEPEMFLLGDYAPVEVIGPRAAELLAFTRRLDDRVVLVVVPLRAAAVGEDAPRYPAGHWSGTRLVLEQAEGWRCALGGAEAMSADLSALELGVPALVLVHG
jgi:(1->4)-alpha-D-glucan 1-alpha-D-glucosylmutase